MIPAAFVQDLLARVDILDVVGSCVDLKRAGSNFSGLCPFHAERSPSFTVVPSKQFYHCFGCGAHGDAVAFLMEESGLSFIDAVRGLAHQVGMIVPGHEGQRLHAVAAPAAPRPFRRIETPTQHETLSDFGRELWAACRPLAGPALAYLQARTCVVPPVDGDLRYHPALKHPPSGTVGPALVALVTDAVTGEPLTLHRTCIRADGTKADVDPPRMLLGGHRKAGGVVRLWPDDAVTQGLGVAEGIETALSLAHAFTPVWACIDAGNLATLPVLAGIEALTIAADHDDAGIAAADACGQRWADAEVEASIVMPPDRKTDLNDMARAA